MYLRARYYQAGTGRFLTPDPFPGVMMQPGTLHPYAYTGSNPVNRIDPSGHCFILAGVDTMVCLGLVVGGAILVGGTAYIVTSEPYQNALQDLIKSFPLQAPAGYAQQTPPTSLQPCSEPNYWPNGTAFTNRLLYSVLMFSLAQQERMVEALPLGQGLDLFPPFVTANSREFNRIYDNGQPISRRDQQSVRNRDLLQNLAEEYPHIRSGEWKKVEQWFQYRGREYDLHWVEARGIIERGKVD